jgi:hypothetical protein
MNVLIAILQIIGLQLVLELPNVYASKAFLTMEPLRVRNAIIHAKVVIRTVLMIVCHVKYRILFEN